MEGQREIRCVQSGNGGKSDEALPRISGNENASSILLPENNVAPRPSRKAPRKKTRGNTILLKRDFSRVFPMGAEHKAGYFEWKSRCIQLQRQSTRLAKVLLAQEIVERAIRGSERAHTERLLRRAADGLALPSVGAVPSSLSDSEATDVEAS